MSVQVSLYAQTAGADWQVYQHNAQGHGALIDHGVVVGAGSARHLSVETGAVFAICKAHKVAASFDEGLLSLCRPISLLYGESL
jgi:hypothetical protein